MNKKGFTLVELLAVIVIMAILAVITTPIVINLINSSKENANKRSIENYAKSVESAYLQAKMDKKSINTLGDLIEEGYLKTSGNEVSCNIEVGLFEDPNNRDTIRLTDCFVKEPDGKQKSKYRYNYINDKLEKITDDNETNSQDGYESYEIGDEIIAGNDNSKYYVIANSDENQEYVVALKADPLTYDEVSSYDSEHVKRQGYWGIESGAYNVSGYAAVAYYASNECRTSDHHGGTVIGCNSNYNDSDIKYIVDLWADKHFQDDDLKIVNNFKSRLITIQEYSSINNFEWKYLGNINNASYWTMSQYDQKRVKVISPNGDVQPSITLGDMGPFFIRPVINIYKSKISK